MNLIVKHYVTNLKSKRTGYCGVDPVTPKIPLCRPKDLPGLISIHYFYDPKKGGNFYLDDITVL